MLCSGQTRNCVRIQRSGFLSENPSRLCSLAADLGIAKFVNQNGVHVMLEQTYFQVGAL